MVERASVPLLYDFQAADVENLLEHGATGFVVAETGAGKTRIGLATAVRSNVPTKLIVAPRGTHEKVWRNTLLGHIEDDPQSEHYGQWIPGLDEDAVIRRIDSTIKGKESLEALEWKQPGFYIMSPNIFTSMYAKGNGPLTSLRPDLTLVDEAHMLGNRDSQGGEALRSFAGATGHKMVMSGTMIRNSFENFWNLLRFVYPERNTPGDIADIGPRRWIVTYCATKSDIHAASGMRVVDELRPGTIAERIPCYIQHFKRAECCEFHLATPEFPTGGFLAHVPEPIVVEERIEMLPEQKKMIRQMEDDYLAWLEVQADQAIAAARQGEKKALIVDVPLVRATRLSQMTLAVPSLRAREWRATSTQRAEFGIEWTGQDGTDWIWTDTPNGAVMQALDKKTSEPLWDVFFEPDAKSPKFDRLLEVVKREAEPIVAATNSQQFAELCVARMIDAGYRAFEWSSKHSQKVRDQALADFKHGLYDIIIGVTEAIGTGIDGLQDASGVLVSLNKSRDLTSEIQLEGRLDRRGQRRKEGVLHIEIIAEGSMDEGIISEQLERRLKLNRSLRRELNSTRRTQ